MSPAPGPPFAASARVLVAQHYAALQDAEKPRVAIFEAICFASSITVSGATSEEVERLFPPENVRNYSSTYSRGVGKSVVMKLESTLHRLDI